MNKRKRILFTFILISFLALATEALAWGALTFLWHTRHFSYEPTVKDHLLESQRKTLNHFIQGTSYYRYDPELGWTIQPHGKAPEAGYYANAQGLRGSHDYPEHPAPGILRVEAFGDSFTHSDEVKNQDMWSEILEREGQGKIEVMNFGVSGYGLDQAYLRYLQEGVQFHPHIVLIDFMSENIERVVNVFRPFYIPETNFPLSKPRFEIHEGHLKLYPNPLHSIADYEAMLRDDYHWLHQMAPHDYHYKVHYGPSRWDFLSSVRMAKLVIWTLRSRFSKDRILNAQGVYDRESEAYQVVTQLLEQFYREVKTHGSQPLIVLFPSESDLRHFREGGHVSYEPLKEDLEAKGYQIVDLLEGFKTYGKDKSLEELFTGLHYSPLGNQIVEKVLWEYLSKQKMPGL